MAEEGALATIGDQVKSSAVGAEKKHRRWSVVSRLWKGLFGDEDLQKKLEYLSREEVSVETRLRRRARWSQKMSRNFIYLSVISEVVAASYAMATRSKDSDWKRNALHATPLFVIFVLSAGIYKGFTNLMKMLDSKDQKTLEWLRDERKAKIDKLKEKTNYYSTQQLIERYDIDHGANSTAASVLAYKLATENGYDSEQAQPTGLRNRKISQSGSHSAPGSTTHEFYNETLNEFVVSAQEIGAPAQRVVEHVKSSVFGDGGWLARIAALLVGEDPTQCYALICAHCHMHNGLAKKEDFPYITYYCPHCHGLNGSARPEEAHIPLMEVENIRHRESNSSSPTKLGLATTTGEIPRGTNRSEIDELDCGTPTSAVEEEFDKYTG